MSVPDPHDTVSAGRRETLAIRAEGQGVDLALMAVQGEDPLAGCRIPDGHLAVPAARDDPPAVGAPDDAQGDGGVRALKLALEHLRLVAAHHVPDPQTAISADGDELP